MIGFCTAPLAFADEAVMDVTAQETEQPAESEALSPALGLISTVNDVATGFEAASKVILAGGGDRETSEVRRSVALWAAGTAGNLRKTLGNLESTELARRAADARSDAKLASVKAGLEDQLEGIRIRLKLLDASAQPDVVADEVDALKAAMRDLQTALVEPVVMRPLHVELTFASAMKPDEAELFVHRLEELDGAHMVMLTPEAEDLGVDVILTGEAPEALNSAQVRDILSTVFLPLAVEGAEDVPAVLPTPNYIGITAG